MRLWRPVSLLLAAAMVAVLAVALATPVLADRAVSKTVDKISACSNETLNYTVTIKVDNPPVNVVVVDLFLYGADFVANSAKLTDPTGSTQAIGNPVLKFKQLNRIEYNFELGSLIKKGEYKLAYKGKMPTFSSSQCSGIVANEVKLLFNGQYAGFERVDTARACNCTDPCPTRFRLAKTAGVEYASPGSIIPYTVEFDLTSESAVSLEDLFLYGVDYVPGSAKLNGKPIADPVLAIKQLNRIVYDWNFSSLKCGKYVLTCDGRVDPNKPAVGQKVRNEVHFFLNGSWKRNFNVDTNLRP